jgi:hypothetical protein
MELIIHSPSEDGFLKEINFNHEEIKTELVSRLEKYQGLVFSDEEIKLAKTERATLRGFKDAIECKRKEVKKQCMLPYESFEEKIKEITALVDKPINEIDVQIKAFEEKTKQEKKENIAAIYNEMIGELKEVLSLKTLWNEKWLNVTYGIPAIAQEIIKTIERTRSDFTIIEDLKSEFELQMKDRYLETMLLSEALAVKTKLEQQKIKLEEIKKHQEEKLAEHEQRQVTITSAVTPKINNSEASTTIHKIQDQNLPQGLEQIDFRVWVTTEQKQLLREFFLSTKIKIGKVQNGG